MKCPIDQKDLVMSDRHGIEIDYCPSCRGVWLDRGELDKIIERSSGPATSTSYDAPPSRHGYDDGKHKKRKRESILGELFDF